MARILLVEDDPTLRETVSAALARAGHSVTTAATGTEAVERFAAAGADLVVLDLMLPGLGGFEVTRRLRAMRRDLPLIMATARGQEHERVQGLQHGADDYLTKPYSLRELDLRIRALLRRATAAPAEVPDTLIDGDVHIALTARRVSRGGVPVPLTSREFDLLVWLVQHPGVVHPRDDLIRNVWRWNVGDDSTVTVHVRRLREKIEADPSAPTRLITVFGKGYRWDAADPAPPEAGSP